MNAQTDLARVAVLYRDRVANLNELADAAHAYLCAPHPAPELLAQHLSEPVRAALATLRTRLSSVAWEAPALSAAIKETITAHTMKMPQLAIPLRVVLLGQPQSPAIDAVLEVLGRNEVCARIDRALS